MIIGIDIGTSYSSVACLKDGKTAEKIKPLSELDYSIPSAVYMKEDGTLIIGRGAKAIMMKDPSRYKDNFKRDFGTDKPYLLGDQAITPDEIYTTYFRCFKQSVETFTGEKITKAYITHPVGYNAQKKILLQQAANYAGLMNITLIDEPTAAALSYFADHKPRVGEKLLIYDLGGGTFDLTLAEITPDGLRPLTDPIGDTNLGGADFDRLLYNEIIEMLAKENNISAALQKTQFTAKIHEDAINAKMNLSRDTEALVVIALGLGDMLELTITRERFNTLIASHVDTSCRLIEQIAKNAGLTPTQIDRILCVGGSTRIPYVTMRVEETVCKPVLKTADPELAVCMGAVLKEVVKIDSFQERQPKSKPETKTASKPEAKPKTKTTPEPERKPENLRAQAEAGEMEAQFHLGEAYAKGQNMPRDFQAAVKWYRKAAEQGYAPAQFCLGNMYARGRGVSQNDTSAIYWYRRAARQGHTDAETNLSLLQDKIQNAENDLNDAYAPKSSPKPDKSTYRLRREKIVQNEPAQPKAETKVADKAAQHDPVFFTDTKDNHYHYHYLYTAQKDGSGKKCLLQEDTYTPVYYKGYVYYLLAIAGEKKYIGRINLKTGAPELLNFADDTVFTKFEIQGDILYGYKSNGKTMELSLSGQANKPFENGVPNLSGKQTTPTPSHTTLERLTKAFQSDTVLPVLFAGQAQAALQSDSDGFSLIIDEVYTLKGRGTVVTGVVDRGAVKCNDTLDLCDAAGKTLHRITIGGIEMGGVLIDSARTGDIIGLWLKGAPYSETQKRYRLIKKPSIESTIPKPQTRQAAEQYAQTTMKKFNITSERLKVIPASPRQYPPKLKAAIAHYAKLSADEYPLIQLDDTFFGGGKDGFIITTKSIYYHNSLMASGMSISLQQLSAVTLERELNYYVIILTAAEEKYRIHMTQVDKAQLLRICDMIKAIQRDFGV